MCGIIGSAEIKSKRNFNFSEGGNLANYIAMRGPDNYAVLEINDDFWHINLAHSRLGIIDLSPGSNQPISSFDGRYSLIFNGEIYNYIELRDELISLGRFFNTNGDTEVLLAAWEIWGINCLPKLNGMFAFTIFDNCAKEFYLVRDRFGVKPLLFFHSQEEMLFSSSISALANQINATVDLTYCASGIKFGFFEGNGCRSPFKEIKYVSPGSFVKFSLGEIISMETTQWYSLSDEVEKRVFETSLLSNYEIEDRIRFLLDDAVKIRLHCDVPVAVSLSGGVDSSSIAAIASAYTCGFKAFSYSSPNMNKSEGPFVERFINEKNIPIEYIYPDYNKSELGDLFDRTCRAQEAPFLGLSIMAQQEIYRVVKSRGYRVLLGGQGGDEIFAGYRKFILIALKNSLQSRNFESFFNQLISLSSVILYGIQDIGLNVRQSHRYFKSGGRTISLINCLPEFSEDLITNKTLRERQILDIQNFSLPSLLRYEDRNSMSNSIESRLPFMDYRLVEFALSISDALKIKSGYGKWILRKSMSHYVPKFILENRNKRGFDVSQNWIIGGVGDRIRDNLLSNLSKTKEFLHDGTNLEIMITKENLKNNTNLLNEAMMLNFLIEPVKNPL